MCVAFLSGVWWIFPLIGFAICAGFMLVMFLFARTGRGCMCMGGPRDTANDVPQPVPATPASR